MGGIAGQRRGGVVSVGLGWLGSLAAQLTPLVPRCTSALNSRLVADLLTMAPPAAGDTALGHPRRDVGRADTHNARGDYVSRAAHTHRRHGTAARIAPPPAIDV